MRFVDDLGSIGARFGNSLERQTYRARRKRSNESNAAHTFDSIKQFQNFCQVVQTCVHESVIVQQNKSKTSATSCKRQCLKTPLSMDIDGSTLVYIYIYIYIYTSALLLLSSNICIAYQVAQARWLHPGVASKTDIRPKQHRMTQAARGTGTPVWPQHHGLAQAPQTGPSTTDWPRHPRQAQARSYQ